MANKAADQGLRQARHSGAQYLARRHLNMLIESCGLKACYQFCVHRLIPQFPSQESIVNGVIKVVDMMVLCSTLGLPLATIGVAAAFAHCIQDERYNNELLLDLLSRSYDSATAASRVQVLELAVGD
jgi:hypothetical protein